MGWFILVEVFTTWLSILGLARFSEQEKELEIVVLCQQLAILQRKLDKRVKPTRNEKLILAVLAVRLKQIGHKSTSQLVQRKWTYEH